MSKLQRIYRELRRYLSRKDAQDAAIKLQKLSGEEFAELWKLKQ